jgi:glycosyltransferase involved in cell wall biosynthesis
LKFISVILLSCPNFSPSFGLERPLTFSTTTTRTERLNLFLLTSDLGTSDAAEQLALLAANLPRERFALSAGVLGPANGPAADALRAAGVPVASLPIRGLLDFSGMRRLRQAVSAADPAVVHCFGPEAVRAARLFIARGGDGNVPRLVASAAAIPGGGAGGWLATRQLGRADRVIATGRAQGERYRRLGVRGERLTLVGPAVVPPGAPPDRAAFCRDIGAPPDAKFVFAGGRLDEARGVKDAVVAFDMIRYEAPGLHLVLTGGGPERAAAEDLARALAFDDNRVRFSGPRADLPAATRLAEMVWVTCEHGGEHLALRAMAAGKPVVAYHTPELAEVVDDGVTGWLVPPGDRVAVAGKAQALLADAALAAKAGEAGRARAADRFGVAHMVEMHARVYQELAGA